MESWWSFGLQITNWADGISNEWDALFGDEVLESKFQDGHYVYTVVAGGTGNDVSINNLCC